MKVSYVLLFSIPIIFWFDTCKAQPNMVSNGGFETLESAHVIENATFERTCDNREGAYVFYDNHTIGTVYQLGVPDNMYGSQQPHGGEKYGGTIRLYYTQGWTTECRRGGKIIFHLNETVYKGYDYTLKFFSSHMDDSDVNAQLEVTLDNDQNVFDFGISDKTNWQEKTVTFTANDNYNDVVFEVTNSMPYTNNLAGVYIDDVSLALTCQLEDLCNGLDPFMFPVFSGNPVNQTTAFKIDNLENVQTCSIIIRNSFSQTIYSKTVECEHGIDQALYWKGVTDAGSPVANGTYNYEIWVTNDCGSKKHTGTIVKSATFTGSVPGFSCDPNGYTAPKVCCEYVPDIFLDNLNWVNQDLLFHATSEIIVSSANPVIVGNGSNVIMRAGERIELNAGFSTNGSESFVAEIVACPSMRLANPVDNYTEENDDLEKIDNLSSISEESFRVFPNPNSGSFIIESHDIQQVIVMDASGKLIRRIDGLSRSMIQIDDFSSGLYLIRAQMANGNVQNAKVVVQ